MFRFKKLKNDFILLKCWLFNCLLSFPFREWSACLSYIAAARTSCQSVAPQAAAVNKTLISIPAGNLYLSFTLIPILVPNLQINNNQRNTKTAILQSVKLFYSGVKKLYTCFYTLICEQIWKSVSFQPKYYRKSV